MPSRPTITARPHGKVDHNGHRRARVFRELDDPRSSWFAYGLELAGMIGVRPKRRRRSRR